MLSECTRICMWPADEARATFCPDCCFPSIFADAFAFFCVPFMCTSQREPDNRKSQASLCCVDMYTRSPGWSYQAGTKLSTCNKAVLIVFVFFLLACTAVISSNAAGLLVIFPDDGEHAGERRCTQRERKKKGCIIFGLIVATSRPARTGDADVTT